MYKQSREELINQWKAMDPLDKEAKAFLKMPHEEKADPEVFESFCKSHSGYEAILLSDDRICDNKELVIIAKKYGFFSGYHLLSDRLLSDPEMALVLAKCNQYEYTKINKSLRDDPELMLKAIKINPTIYCSLPVKVKVDRRIVLEVAKKDPYQLKHLLKVGKKQREHILSDKEIALIIGRKDPRLLYECFDESIQHDSDVLQECFSVDDEYECRKILRENPWAIKFVDSNIWKDDMDLLIEALGYDGSLFAVIPDELRRDKRLALLAIRNCPYALAYCAEELKDDEAVVKAALQPDSEDILLYASDRLKADYDIVYRAVKVDALNLQYASEELRDNLEIVTRAIKTYGGVLDDASERLRNDPELIKIAERNM